MMTQTQLRTELDQLFRRQHQSLVLHLRYRMNFSTDDANDIVQDAYVHLLNLNPPDLQSLPAYLRRTAENLAINAAIRKRTRRRLDRLVLLELPEESRTPAHLVDVTEQVAVLNERLNRLPDPASEMLFLVQVCEMSVAAAAAQLGIPTCRGRRYLEQALVAVDRCQRAA